MFLIFDKKFGYLSLCGVFKVFSLCTYIDMQGSVVWQTDSVYKVELSFVSLFKAIVCSWFPFVI